MFQSDAGVLRGGGLRWQGCRGVSGRLHLACICGYPPFCETNALVGATAGVVSAILGAAELGDSFFCPLRSCFSGDLRLGKVC